MIRARRDEAEFRDFAERFSPTLLRTAYLLVRDREAAQDAVQTTLMRTFTRWSRARSAPEPYSRRVLINVCRNLWRTRSRRPELSGVEDGSATVGCETGRVDERLSLDAALGTLAPTQRAVLVLRFYLDLSVSETASLLDIAEGTVKSATHRGLDELRRLLDDQPQEVLDRC